MRIKLLHLAFISLFIFLTGCLFYLQIIKGPLYSEMSSRNSIRLINIPAPRGIIYDRNRSVIGEDTFSFGVFIIPQESDDVGREIKKIAEILDIKEGILKRKYKRNYLAPFAPCEIIRDISKKQAIIIQELKLDMKGVLVKEIPSRRYPYAEMFAHITGYVGEIDREELTIFKEYGYQVKDMIGKDGVEKIKDSTLRGKNGGMQIQVDNRGHQVNILSERKSKKGNNVFLTFDASLQAYIWELMKDNAGSCIVMDTRTGEILALISSPSYDPNESVAKVFNIQGSPLMNRAIMGQYSPGSLFKLVVALSGLESEIIDRDKVFECLGGFDVGGRVFHCWNRDGHGPMHLKDAITQSCNIYFYKLSMMLGIEKIMEYAKEFRFGKATGIELLGEKPGFLPTRAWKRQAKKERWYTGDTLNHSIGQGYLLVTPLQVVRMMAAIANGEYLLRPHIIKDDDLSSYKTKLRFKKENIDLIREGMRGVVAAPNGTGYQAWSELVPISGKTGTSQVSGGKMPHAWFGGFAPSSDPEIALVVFLEHGGSGGDQPAFIARGIVEYWYKNMRTDKQSE
ncbi:MAG: penicillin-binding protein 2 [Candidatus Omnitrophota bacterium]